MQRSLENRDVYTDDQIFNANKVSLCFKFRQDIQGTPDKILKFKGEKCMGGTFQRKDNTVYCCKHARK